MSFRRRHLLTASAGLLLVEKGGYLRVARAQGADPLAPWRTAPAATDPDPRRRAAAWAVLAPNPHNRQPWLLRLDGDGGMTLFCDLDRRLPVTDPLDRQITIGLGAFLELFRLALAEQGIAAAITPFPEGEPAARLDRRPVARVALAAGGRPDPLFAAAPARRSAKLPFDMARPPEAADVARLRAALLRPEGLGAATDPAEVARLRDLVWQAWTIEAETPAAHAESVKLMRLGSPEVAANPDGISIWGPQLDPLVARGELTRDAMWPGRPGHALMVARYREMLAQTPAHVWIATPDNSRAAQLAAGQDWLRLSLAATAAGLALHPVSQALQEYPEMAGPRAALPALLGARGTVQMLGRLGRVERAAPPTPRWPAESRILGA